MTTAPQEWKSSLWELKCAEKLALAGIGVLDMSKDDLNLLQFHRSGHCTEFGRNRILKRAQVMAYL